MGDIGYRLRSTREESGLTFNDAEKATKIRTKYLKALEEEHFHILPGQSYIRPFLRSYASFLGLSLDDICDSKELNKIAPSPVTVDAFIDDPDIEHRFTAPATKQAPEIDYLFRRIALGIIAVIVILALLIFFRGSGKKTTDIEAATPKTSNSTTMVRIKMLRPAWVRITLDDEKVHEGVLVAGTAQTWRGRSIKVLSGDSGALLISENKDKTKKLGKDNQIQEKDFQAQ